MIEGKRIVGYVRITFAKKSDIFGDNVIPYYCRECGYIELYKEMKEGVKPRVST